MRTPAWLLFRPACRIITVLAALSLLSTCEQPTDVDEGGPGIIVPGKSIEGINLGDARESVEMKLGKPDAGGIVDGLHRAWYAADYLQGSHAGLSVYFVEIGNKSGPVDVLGVKSPYAGKTKEGVRIGSPLATARQMYGLPQKTLIPPESNYILDTYCFNGKHFNIGYRDSVVTGFNMGYYLPMPQDTTYPCR